jgi:hypothetical protein
LGIPLLSVRGPCLPAKLFGTSAVSITGLASFKGEGHPEVGEADKRGNLQHTTQKEFLHDSFLHAFMDAGCTVGRVAAPPIEAAAPAPPPTHSIEEAFRQKLELAEGTVELLGLEERTSSLTEGARPW